MNILLIILLALAPAWYYLGLRKGLSISWRASGHEGEPIPDKPDDITQEETQ